MSEKLLSPDQIDAFRKGAEGKFNADFLDLLCAQAKGNAKGTAPGDIPVRLFLRLLAQACGSFDNVEIDHSFIGPYEDACDWAVTNGFAVETPTGCKLNQYPFKGE